MTAGASGSRSSEPAGLTATSSPSSSGRPTAGASTRPFSMITVTGSATADWTLSSRGEGPRRMSTRRPENKAVAAPPSCRSPSRRRLEPDSVNEVMQALERLLGRHGRAHAAPPVGPVLGPYHQVVVANYLRPVLTKERRQPRLEFILVSDQKVAGRAVPTGLVQSYKLHRVDVDDQG